MAAMLPRFEVFWNVTIWQRTVAVGGVGRKSQSDRKKANVLAYHFANVFKAYESEVSSHEEREIPHALDTPGRLKTPVKKFKISEVRSAIN
jgi:hypothetical protein